MRISGRRCHDRINRGGGLQPAALVGLGGLVAGLVGLSWWMGQRSFSWLPVQASTAAPLVDGLFSFETAIGTFVFGGWSGSWP